MLVSTKDVILESGSLLFVKLLGLRIGRDLVVCGYG
jgi:hypothetical protein